MSNLEFEQHVNSSGDVVYKVLGAPYDFFYGTKEGARAAWEIWQENRRKHEQSKANRHQ